MDRQQRSERVEEGRGVLEQEEGGTATPGDEPQPNNSDGKQSKLAVEAERLTKSLAAELTSLPADERTHATLDLHGCVDEIEETADMVDKNLAQMDENLTRLIDEDKAGLTAAYHEAFKQSPDYVNDRQFRLCFLRATAFDPVMAATRCCKFLNIKNLIFGSELLTKEIEMKHLTEETRKLIQSGYLQILPIKDRSGRPVLLNIIVLRGEEGVPTLLETFCFMIMELARDVETQKKGFVLLQMNYGPGYTDIEEAVEAMKAAAEFQESLPCRISAKHSCYDDINKKAFAVATTAYEQADVRVRARLHQGPLEKIKLELMSYGITTTPEVFPISNEGELDLTFHNQWFDRKLNPRALPQAADLLPTENDTDISSPTEESTASDEHIQGSVSGGIVEFPSPKDILLGRSAVCRSHPGNVKYRSAIEENLEEYTSNPSYRAKSQLIQRVIAQMKQSEARFLCEQGHGTGLFVNLSDGDAHDKVANAFRDQLKRRRKKDRGEGSSVSSGTTAQPTPSNDASGI